MFSTLSFSYWVIQTLDCMVPSLEQTGLSGLALIHRRVVYLQVYSIYWNLSVFELKILFYLHWFKKRVKKTMHILAPN